jgi:hypothetical protein
MTDKGQLEERVARLELENALLKSQIKTNMMRKRGYYGPRASRSKFVSRWLYEERTTHPHQHRALESDFRRVLPPPPAGQRWYLRTLEIPKELLAAEEALRKLCLNSNFSQTDPP